MRRCTLRDILAHSFEMPAANVKVISRFVVGAFGSKNWTFQSPLGFVRGGIPKIMIRKA